MNSAAYAAMLISLPQGVRPPLILSATRAILNYHRSTLERARLEGVSVYHASCLTMTILLDSGRSAAAHRRP